MSSGHFGNPSSNIPPASPASDLFTKDTNAGEPTGRGLVTDESNPFKSPEGSQIDYPGSHQLDEAPVSNKTPSNVGNGSGISVLGHLGDPATKFSPLPPPPQAVRLMDRPMVHRQMTGASRPTSPGRRSNNDWSVPVSEPEEKPFGRTYAERLQPTLDVALLERDKYAAKAKITGWTLNAAIGLQVLFGSLTTGLSAVATSGRSAAVQTTILGGLSTIVASYLARARGSNEPELSITRVKDLEQFIRECQAFQMDFGHQTGSDHDGTVLKLRSRFEELLGNANGERKLSPPV